MDLPPAIPAATVILVRPQPDGPPHILMLERHASMAFAAGALVFPGGRVDPGDEALAADAGDPVDIAARIAAIRETIEEVGLAIGLEPAPAAETVAALRAGLAAGEGFGALLARHGLALDPAALTPFSRWRPDHPEVRRFDTRFYLAEAPADADAVADGSEGVAVLWASAADLLADADAGRHRIIFPTRCNLARVAAQPDLAALRDNALRHPIRRISPFVERRADGDWLCIPADLGYPFTAERLDQALRR